MKSSTRLVQVQCQIEYELALCGSICALKYFCGLVASRNLCIVTMILIFATITHSVHQHQLFASLAKRHQRCSAPGTDHVIPCAVHQLCLFPSCHSIPDRHHNLRAQVLQAIGRSELVREMCQSAPETWTEPQMRAMLHLSEHPVADTMEVEEMRHAAKAFDPNMFAKMRALDGAAPATPSPRHPNPVNRSASTPQAAARCAIRHHQIRAHLGGVISAFLCVILQRHPALGTAACCRWFVFAVRADTHGSVYIFRDVLGGGFCNNPSAGTRLPLRVRALRRLSLQPLRPRLLRVYLLVVVPPPRFKRVRAKAPPIIKRRRPQSARGARTMTTRPSPSRCVQTNNR